MPDPGRPAGRAPSLPRPAETVDVVAVGNAIMDLVADVDDDFLARHGLDRGRMVIGSQSDALAMTDRLPAGRRVAGGSAANTAVGVASLGGRAAFLGRCARDPLGHGFRDSLHEAGVAHPVDFGPLDPPTGRSIVLVAPDHERTMMTYPGAAATLAPRHLPRTQVAGGAILFVEGYLFYSTVTAETARTAADWAAAHGRTVALSLSDPNCVTHHRTALLALVRARTDILFANEEEITALYRSRSFEEAAAAAGADVETAFLTRGAAGAVVVQGDQVRTVPAAAVPGSIEDLTGAGDLFAAGTLFGMRRGLDPRRAARVGAACAAEVISHHGARPEADLRQLVTDAGLI